MCGIAKATLIRIFFVRMPFITNQEGSMVRSSVVS